MNDVLTLLSIVLVVIGFACITPYISVVLLERAIPSFKPLYAGARRLARVGQVLGLAVIAIRAVNGLLT